MSNVQAKNLQLRNLSSRQMAFYRFKSNPLALIGGFIVISVTFVAIFAPYLAP